MRKDVSIAISCKQPCTTGRVVLVNFGHTLGSPHIRALGPDKKRRQNEILEKGVTMKLFWN